MTTDQPVQEPKTEPTPKRNPLIDLVEHLTPDTSGKLKAILLPPRTGLIYTIGPLAFKIGYINPGKMQFNSEFYGLIVEGGILRPGGRIETPEETHAQAQPVAPQTTKNGNVTLDVQSGAIDATAIFGKRQGEQTPVA